ncbi:MAG TPA: hypothetical protein VFS76_11135 [Pyrinomonadaceae bacterium]|nr:hypothetical protein [Pyrinomonadaceae bacterium]
MNRSRRAFALSILFLLLTVSSVSVFGQSDRQTSVNIPFDFVVGNKTLTAGEYTVQRNWSTSNATWTIKRRDGSGGVKVFLTVSGSKAEDSQGAQFVFHRYGDLYFLTSFYTVGENTSRELKPSDRERSLDQRQLAQREDVVLTSRGR